jgi:hypothetical protein
VPSFPSDARYAVRAMRPVCPLVRSQPYDQRDDGRQSAF